MVMDWDVGINVSFEFINPPKVEQAGGHPPAPYLYAVTENSPT